MPSNCNSCFENIWVLIWKWDFWPRACEARPTSNEVDHYHHYHHHHHHLHCHRSFWKFFVISLNDDVIHHVCNMIRQDSKSEKYFLNGRFIFSVGGNWKINSKWSKLVIKFESKLFCPYKNCKLFLIYPSFKRNLN